MQYCAHLFIGSEFESLIENSFQIYYKYNANIVDYNKIYNITSNNDTIEIKEYKATFDSKAEAFVYSWEALEATKVSELPSLWANQIYDKILTLSNARGQSKLPVFIHTPLSKSESFKLIDQLCKAINASQRITNVNFIGYAQDMWRFIDVNQETVKYNECNPVSEIKSIYIENGYNTQHNHFIVIQNRTERGIAIFNEDNGTEALYNMVAHIYMLLSSHSESIFSPTYEYRDVIGFGFSSIYFDEYMFVDYMLRRVMMQAMDSQSVNNNDVNINDAGALSESILQDKKTILSKFIEKYPGGDKDAPNYNEIKESVEDIYNRVLEYIKNPNNSDITIKAALLATMLSQTECELFSNSIYSPELTTIDDLYNQSINYFISEDDVVYYKIDGEKTNNPVSRIKEINRELIQLQTDIRKKEEQLKTIKGQIDLNDNVNKCYVDDEGFVTFENKKFRLLPDFNEPPLKDSYEEHEVNIKSVDLRGNFRSIQNQGQQGSCLSFTLTSIFEYLMRSSGQKDYDLSEAFLYYNARNLDEYDDVNVNIDKGSRFHPSIESLMKYGLALEKFWPYDDGVYSKKPSQEAYDDAATRKLVKALNVRLNSDAIKSALSDGYPVAGSFVLYPQFYTTDGYVKVPTPEEIANKKKNADNPDAQERHGQHAMTIVGFNDEIKMFLVRNSWGTDWGDKGYCYIPYDYIDNPECFNFACILTEVASIENIKPELKEFPVLSIDNNSLTTKFYITEALCNLQKELMFSLEKEKIRLVEYFELQKKLYADSNQRDKFIDENVANIDQDIMANKKEIDKLQDKIEEIRKNLDKFRNRLLIKTSIIIVAIFLLAFLFNKLFGFLTLDIGVWKYAIIVSLLYGVYVYVQYHREFKAWRNENRDFESTIRDLKRDIEKQTKRKLLFRHKTFAAWTLITNLDDVQLKLQKLYTSILNLINNLRIWYNEIVSSTDDISFELPLPYISVLSNDKLDAYFDVKLKNSMVCNIDLCEDLENHVIGLEYLSEYKKNIRKVLKEHIVNNLENMEFNLTSHVAENQYADVAVDINTDFVRDWVEQSLLFVQINSKDRAVINSSTLVFAPDVDRWRINLSRKFNGIYPDYINSENKYRMTLFRMASLSFDECVIFSTPTEVK